MKPWLAVAMTAGMLTAEVCAQQAPKPPSAAQEPKVRVTYLNVCTPSEAEQKEIGAALARIPAKPAFTADFEVARGRSTTPEVPGFDFSGSSGAASWVRMRRDFPPESPFGSVQYSFSLDEKDIVETLVFRVRDPKDVLQISIQDTVSASSGADAVLAADTPPNRVKLERFGKSGLALARCPTADQSAYEPLFRAAAQIMSTYRQTLAVRRAITADLARLLSEGGNNNSKPAKNTSSREHAGAEKKKK